MRHNPLPLKTIGLCVLCAFGCRGRSEFLRGRVLLSEGKPREAYAVLYEAWLKSGSPEYRRALAIAGEAAAHRILDERGAAGRVASFEETLDHAALALEYAPSCPRALDLYLRAWAARETAESLAESARGGMWSDPWAGLRAAWSYAGLPGAARPREVLRAALEGVRDAVRAALETAGSGNSSSRDALSRELARIEKLEAEVAAWLEWEAAAAGGRPSIPPGGEKEADLGGWGDPGAGTDVRAALAAEGRVAAALEPLQAPLQAAALGMRAQVEGLTLSARGLALEKEGRFEEALDTFEEALRLAPHLSAALSGRERVRGVLARRAKAEAEVRFRRREWGRAAECLERWLAFEPGSDLARTRLAVARAEAARELRSLAKSLEERGALAEALVARLEALRLRGEAPESRLRVAELENRIRLAVLQAASLRFEGNARALPVWAAVWGFDRGDLDDLRRRVARGFGGSFEAEGTRGAAAWRIVDLDLAVRRTAGEVEVRKRKLLVSYDRAAHPDRSLTARRLEEAESRVRAIEVAPGPFPTVRVERVLLRRGERELARRRLEALPRWSPRLEWREDTETAYKPAFAITLAARLDGAGWVAVSETVESEGDFRGTRSVPPSAAFPPPELVSSTARTLAERLGRELRARWLERRATELEGLLEAGRAACRRGDRSLAIDVLVRFVLERAGSTPPERLQEAARLLAEASGFPAAKSWALSKR